MQQGKARSHAKEQCKGAKGGQSSKGQRVKECKGVKDRLKIYYNSLITNVVYGGHRKNFNNCQITDCNPTTHTAGMIWGWGG